MGTPATGLAVRQRQRFIQGHVLGVASEQHTCIVAFFDDVGSPPAVATDHVIESFRNEIWPGYKTGEGIEPDLLAQFPLLEEVLAAAGITVWPMVEFEADDAIAAAAIAASCVGRRVERNNQRKLSDQQKRTPEHDSGENQPFSSRFVPISTFSSSL